MAERRKNCVPRYDVCPDCGLDKYRGHSSTCPQNPPCKSCGGIAPKYTYEREHRRDCPIILVGVLSAKKYGGILENAQKIPLVQNVAVKFRHIILMILNIPMIVLIGRVAKHVMSYGKL